MIDLQTVLRKIGYLFQDSGVFPDLGHRPTSQKKQRPASRQNHSRGVPKHKRLMAKRSRRINRGK
jgi:hypothetical protein